jgi:hypothetical protein
MPLFRAKILPHAHDIVLIMRLVFEVWNPFEYKQIYRIFKSISQYVSSIFELAVSPRPIHAHSKDSHNQASRAEEFQDFPLHGGNSPLER